MYERFTDKARKVMQLADQEARRFNHAYIGTEHILLGLLTQDSGVAATVLKNLDIDLRKIRLEVEELVQSGPDQVTREKLPPTARAKKVIESAIDEARNLNHNWVGTEHLLLGLLRDLEGVAGQVLMNLGLSVKRVRQEVLQVVGPGQTAEVGESETGYQTRPKKTPALDSFGIDLSMLARVGKLQPIIPRRDQLERLLVVLSCRTQNNPILVGKPGVGKTTLVDSVAKRGVERTGPESAQHRVIALNLARMIAYVTDFEAFEERMTKAIIAEVRQAKNILLFIDDLCALFCIPSVPQVLAAGSMLKSVVMRGEVQCITTATPDEYKAHFAGDSFFARHFQPIVLQPPPAEEVRAMLEAHRPIYETHHRVRIQDDALETAIELSEHYLPEHALPGKALHLLDEAGALVQLRNGVTLPDLKELDAQIEQINRDKETAVAEPDFEKAAHLRE